MAVGLGKQLVGRVEFDNATLVEYHDARAVQYGVESMRYCDNGALAEGALERLLYQAVGVVVDGGGRFVQHEYFGLLQQRSGQTHELTLANTQILAALRTLEHQLAIQALHELFEVGLLKHAPNLVVLERLERIQIGSQRTSEQDGLLLNEICIYK